MGDNSALRHVTIKNYTEFSKIISQHLHSVRELPPPPDTYYDLGPQRKDVVISYCGFNYQAKKPPMHVDLTEQEYPLIASEQKQKAAGRDKDKDKDKVKTGAAKVDNSTISFYWNGLKCPCGCLTMSNLTRTQRIRRKLPRGVCVYHYRKTYQPPNNLLLPNQAKGNKQDAEQCIKSIKDADESSNSSVESGAAEQQLSTYNSYNWWYPLDVLTVARQDTVFELTHSTVTRLYMQLINLTEEAVDTEEEREEEIEKKSSDTNSNAVPRLFPGILNVNTFSIPREYLDLYKRLSAICQRAKNNVVYPTLMKSKADNQISPATGSNTGVTWSDTKRAPLTDATLRFESRFESGNLLQATRLSICNEQTTPPDSPLPYNTEYIANSNGNAARYAPSDQTYFLILRPDTNSTGNTQWYYFAVGNTVPGVRYNFYIANFTKSASQYSEGMMPVVFSETEYMLYGTGWVRGGYDIDYYSNGRYLSVGGGAQDKAAAERGKQSDVDNDNSQDDDSQGSASGSVSAKSSQVSAQDIKPVSCLLGSYYTLSFSYTFKYAGDILYFAHTYPYTYEQAQLWINVLIHKNMNDRRGIDNKLNTALTKALKQTSEGSVDVDIDPVLRREYQLSFAKAHHVYYSRKFSFLSKIAAIKSNPVYKRVVEILQVSDGQQNDVPILSHKVLTKSMGGNDLDMLTITGPSSSMAELRRRRFVVVSARIHPGEAQSSYVCQGLVDYLLSDAAPAQLLRKLYVFKVFPMINPDGVVLGNYRCNLAGADLNRKCLVPSMALHTCVYHFKRILGTLAAATTTDSTTSLSVCGQPAQDDMALGKSRDEDKDAQSATAGESDLSTKDLLVPESISGITKSVIDTSSGRPFTAKQTKQGVPPRPSTCKPPTKRRELLSGCNRVGSSTVLDADPNASTTKTDNFTGNAVVVNLDLHGHSRKTNAFGYACYGDSEEHLYFKALHRLSPYFNIKDCRYSVGKQKECTQRAVSYTQFHIKHSYCIEATFGGITKAGSPKCGLQMCQKDFLNLGRDLCLNLLYFDLEVLEALYAFSKEVLVELYSLLYNKELQSFIRTWFGTESVLARGVPGAREGEESDASASSSADTRTVVLSDQRAHKEFCQWVQSNIAQTDTNDTPYSQCQTAQTMQTGSTLSLPYIYTEDEMEKDLYLLNAVKSITTTLIDPSALYPALAKPQKQDQDGHSSDDDVQVELINPTRPKAMRKKIASPASKGTIDGTDQLTKDILTAQTNEAQLENALENDITIDSGTEKPKIGLSVKRFGKTVYKCIPVQPTPLEEPSASEAGSADQKSQQDAKGADSRAKLRTAPQEPSRKPTRPLIRDDPNLLRTNSSSKASACTTNDNGDGLHFPDSFKTSWGGSTDRGAKKSAQSDIFSRLAKNPYRVLPEKREYMQEAIQATSRLATYSIVTHTVEDLPTDRNTANIADKMQKSLTSSRVWDDTRLQQSSTGGIPSSQSFTYGRSNFAVSKDQDFADSKDADAGPIIAPRRPGSSQRTAVSTAGWHGSALPPSHARLVSVPQMSVRNKTSGRTSVSTSSTGASGLQRKQTQQ